MNSSTLKELSEEFVGTSPWLSEEFEGTFRGVSEEWELLGMNQSSSKELFWCVSEKFPTTPPSWEDKMKKFLSVILPTRNNKSLSSKVHNFLIRCLIEVSFFANMESIERHASSKITEHVIQAFEWIHV
jgi:hypothetical protein